MPLLSIIIPVYNVETFLRECIDSILSQGFKDYELILVDDGSTDLSPEICDEYAKKDKRIIVIHKENGGLVSARKVGINFATGGYILNVDSDDYIVENLLLTLAEIINNNNVDMIAFDYQEISESGELKRIVKNNAIEGLYFGESLKGLYNSLIYDTGQGAFNIGCIIYSVWTKVFKRSLVTSIQNNVPNEIIYGEDIAVTVPALFLCKSLYIVRFTGYYYRARSTSIIHSYSQKDSQKEITSCIKLINYLEHSGFCIPKENLSGFCLRVFHNNIAKVARSLDKQAYILYCNKIYTEWFSQRINSFSYNTLIISKRIIYYLITHQQWYILWKIYHQSKN